MSAVLKSIKRPARRVIYTEVEHEISEWDDDDLLAELERRRVEVPSGHQPSVVEEMYVAMKFGNKDRALALLREYLMDLTGRILP